MVCRPCRSLREPPGDAGSAVQCRASSGGTNVREAVREVILLEPLVRRPSVRPRAHRSGRRWGEAGRGGLKRGGIRWSGKRRRSDGVPARVQVPLRALPRLRSMTPPIATLTPPNSGPVYGAISMGPPFQVSGTPPVPVLGRSRALWASNRARTIGRDLPAAWRRHACLPSWRMAGAVAVPGGQRARRAGDSFRATWRPVRARGSRSGIPAGQGIYAFTVPVWCSHGNMTAG